MSMLKKLKETSSNPLFDEDGPLPSDIAKQAEMMQKLQSMNINPEPQNNDSAIRLGFSSSGVTRSMDPSKYKDWVCVYPCYIDADKHVSEGRKIPQGLAVKAPHAYHMAHATQQLGLSVVYEGKRHPRNWANPGRIRVQLKDESGHLRNSKITHRKQLFKEIASRLPAVQKEFDLPEGIVSPLTSLAKIEQLTGQPSLPSLPAIPAASKQSAKSAKPKKPKIKHVRG